MRYLAAILLLAACGSATEPVFDPAGEYTLEAFDGMRLPYVAALEHGITQTVYAGRMVLHSVGGYEIVVAAYNHDETGRIWAWSTAEQGEWRASGPDVVFDLGTMQRLGTLRGSVIEREDGQRWRRHISVSTR